MYSQTTANAKRIIKLWSCSICNVKGEVSYYPYQHKREVNYLIKQDHKIRSGECKAKFYELKVIGIYGNS